MYIITPAASFKDLTGCAHPPKPSAKYSCNGATHKCEEDPAGKLSLRDCEQGCASPFRRGYLCNQKIHKCVIVPVGGVANKTQCEQACK